MAFLHYNYCAFLLFTVILFSMLTRKVVKGHTNKSFFVVVLLSLLFTLSDILSEVPHFSNTTREFFDYLYFLLSVTIPLVYIYYIYATLGLWHYAVYQRKITYWLITPCLVTIALLILNVFNHCIFYISPEGVYMRGPWNLSIIIISFLYFIASTVIIIKWSHISSWERNLPLLLLTPIVVFFIIIQRFHKGFELTAFGLSIAELIISFTVQRVDENYDSITKTKNFDSAVQDFRKIFVTNQTVQVIFLKITEHTALRRLVGATLYNKFLGVINQELAILVKKYKLQTELYYLHDSTYALAIESSDYEKVKQLGNEISERFKLPFTTADVSFSIKARVCVVRLPEDIDNLDSFLNFRYNFYKKLPATQDAIILADFINSNDFRIKNEMDEIINRAIINHNFKMYYQPIYSIKEKKFVSAEALIRLIDDKYGFVSPALFIPAAETSGAIHEIGDFVIDTVSSFINSVDFNQLKLHYIEMNLSVTQCMETDLVQKFQNVIKTYNIEPKQLNLEITETAENIDSSAMDSNINKLNDLGFSFSLDDYGTGYSNIKRVTQLPLDIIKLDKSFVDEMNEPLMMSIIESTVQMFKNMNKTILVEGIETEESFKIFEKLGCDYIQGYYFSKPLPEEEFIQFLKNHNK
ncbi:MAG: EAL domain-containing protein [Treponema sp.]|nr:EAL domain-containing protein [Treponema sp.]